MYLFKKEISFVHRLSIIVDVIDLRPSTCKHGRSQGNRIHFLFRCIFPIYRVPLLPHGVTPWSVPALEFSAFFLQIRYFEFETTNSHCVN